MNNSKEDSRRFIEPYQPGKAVLEAIRNWWLIYDWLEDIFGLGLVRGLDGEVFEVLDYIGLAVRAGFGLIRGLDSREQRSWHSHSS